MKLIDFFKTKKELIDRISALEFNLVASGLQGHHYSSENDMLRHKIDDLQEENATLRRQLGGYKGGDTRRKNKAASVETEVQDAER